MTTYGVVDVETTGFDHEADRLVEIACVREDGSFSTTLVCPGERRISYGAMATHHITPDQVQNAPGLLNALSIVGLGPRPDGDWQGCHETEHNQYAPDVLVFHNAQFDRGFLPEWLRELPYICTYRCSLHLFPQAERHSNGALWYELGLARQLPEEAGAHPHRALFDALMTRDILEWMINEVAVTGDDEQIHGSFEYCRDYCLQRLVELTSSPVLLTKCRFGKHRDSLWEDVPSMYMEWVLGQDFDEDTKHTCRHWLTKRGRRTGG